VLAYWASAYKGPLVVSYHSDTVRQKLLGALFRPILHRTLKRSAAIIAATQNYIDTSPILPRYGSRCRVIPYGIPAERFRHGDGARIHRIRSQYGPRIVLSVSRLVYYKGLDHLLRAMAKVPARLLIAGEGPLRSSLEREVLDLGLGERVVFLGEVEDVTPYYQAADVFVLPSVARSEAFGIVQLEAMACGTPVVNTRLASGVPYVSLDGLTGFTVPPADSEALAVAINRLLDDRNLRAKLGQAGVRRVCQEFSLEVMTRRTLDLYQEVMECPGRSAN
jgi:glycosyltransferase involved in cell wall biosynthesis